MQIILPIFYHDDNMMKNFYLQMVMLQTYHNTKKVEQFFGFNLKPKNPKKMFNKKKTLKN